MTLSSLKRLLLIHWTDLQVNLHSRSLANYCMSWVNKFLLFIFVIEDGLAIRTCFKHLIACLNFVFGWGEASSSNHRSQILEVFESIASKIAAGASTGASTQRAASEALEVFEKEPLRRGF